MTEKKIIVVFGATGAQGGGLARAILNDPASEFSVRAVTRDIDSPASQALAKLGAELVWCDIDSLTSVRSVLEGAYGAYFVTFFWSHFSAEKEKAQAKIMADAAKAEGLKHVIWSTLEDVRTFVPLHDSSIPTLHGTYKVPHFDGKGESDAFFAEAGVPTTYQLASFYWENLLFFGMGPKRDAEGTLRMSFPLGDKKMAGIASEDIGRCAYGIFKNPAETIGKHIGVSGDHLSGKEMAQRIAAALNEEVVYADMSPESYRRLGFPGADDLGNMFQFYRDFDKECNSVRDVSRSKQLNPELQSFDDWLRDNAKRLPLV